MKLLKNSSVLFAFSLVVLFCSCNSEVEDATVINLKWNKSFPTDSLERNKVALKWHLSHLGASIANDTTEDGILEKEDSFTLDLKQVGFSENAIKSLSELHQKIKQSEEYQINKSVDLGRYIALTLGDSYEYYKITGVPENLGVFDSIYRFNETPGYINNSSISLVDRIISYSKNNTGEKQAYISAETDSTTKEILEFETIDIMPNGQLRFGIYDQEGKLKIGADKNVTKAGKPAKCMWCHESNIQPLYRDQIDIKGYLAHLTFQDSLVSYNKMLRAYQDSIWKDESFRKRRLHAEMEITYFAFMEPSAEHLANEWNIPLKEVKIKLKHLPTHKHHEFQFLGDSLYDRKEVDAIAPFSSLKVVDDLRE